MPRADQRLAHHGDRICKVEEPRLRAALGERFGDLNRWWHSAQCLRPTAGTNRLLAEDAVGEWDRFIFHARRRSADAVLH